MFTPPPSPLPEPSQSIQDQQQDYFTQNLASKTPIDAKVSQGRRLKLIAILVPSLMVLITISSQLITRTTESSYTMQLLDRRQTSDPGLSASPSPAPTPTQAGSPSIPAQPILPTPFPQPFDEIAANFSTNSCQNFFSNMTNTQPFRSCRAFSLLLSSSDDFLVAQRNLSSLNSIVWGTCNTPPGFDQCASNMDWFASALQTACSTEIQNQNPAVTTALNGLLSYKFMSTVGCMMNPRTNTYCYLDAVSSTNPSDAYYFQLGLGSPLPSTTNSSCSACVQSIMNVYATYAQTTVNGQKLGLGKVFADAEQLTTQQCGSTFVQAASVNAAASLGNFGSLRILCLLILTIFIHFR